MRKPSCLSSCTQPSPIGGHAHPVVAQSIALMLSTEPIEVETASLGESGLDLGRLERHDLILLDLNLPEISGFEVLRALRLRSRRS